MVAGGTESGSYPFSAVGEARYEGTAAVRLDVFTFSLSGFLANDGGGPEAIFTISTAGGQDTKTLHAIGGHFTSVNETFVSIPLLVTDGNYTAVAVELRFSSCAFCSAAPIRLDLVGARGGT